MKIAGYSAGVVGLGKAAFYRQVEMPQSSAYAMTKDVIAGNAALADGQEGMKAFLEKRPAVWSDSAPS